MQPDHPYTHFRSVTWEVLRCMPCDLMDESLSKKRGMFPVHSILKHQSFLEKKIVDFDMQWWVLECRVYLCHISFVSFDNSFISTITFKWQDFRKTGWYFFGWVDFTNRLVLEFFLYFCAAACVSRSNSPHEILAGREHTSYNCICTHLCVVVHIICALRMKVGLFQSCLSIKAIRQGFSACHLSATLPRHPAL